MICITAYKIALAAVVALLDFVLLRCLNALANGWASFLDYSRSRTSIDPTKRKGYCCYSRTLSWLWQHKR